MKGRASRLALAGWAALCAPAFAQATQEADIIVRGIVPDEARVPGAVQTLDAATLQRAAPLSGKDALRRIAGLQVVDEDALGLKLNVSVRGLAPRRSGRTLILEDGAPVQPAPYADPSAHHHPPLERVTRIEAQKGAGQIAFGPQSFGGVLNFVTTAPSAPGGLSIAVGERDYATWHARVASAAGDDGAFSLDLIGKTADGARHGHDTSLFEAMAQAELSLSAHQQVRVKAAYYEERSAITESGLSQARFDADPFDNPFESDRFELDRIAGQIVHEWRLAQHTTLTTQAYIADLYRASFRQTDTSTDAMIANLATGCVGAARIDYEGFAARCGNKMRPRDFLHYGVESRLSVTHEAFGADFSTQVGARFHGEETRRRRFNGSTPNSRPDSPDAVLRDDNAIDVRAFSAFALTQAQLGEVTLTPGVRVEDFETRNAAAVANFLPVQRSARAQTLAVLPGLGLTWAPTNDWTLFAGVHRGIAPPRPDRDIDPNAPMNPVRPEESVTTELGVRAHVAPRTRIAATLFRMDLSDLIVEGPLVGGRSGTFVNAGAARHEGLETVFHWRSAVGVMLDVAYAYLWDATFRSDVTEAGAGVRGNRVPYAPEHVLDVALGLERGAWTGEVGVNYVDDQFADSSNQIAPSADGQKGLIPARTLYRAALSYSPQSAPWRLRLSAQNLTDETYLSARTDGAFAGAPRQVALDLSVGF